MSPQQSMGPAEGGAAGGPCDSRLLAASFCRARDACTVCRRLSMPAAGGVAGGVYLYALWAGQCFLGWIARERVVFLLSAFFCQQMAAGGVYLYAP